MSRRTLLILLFVSLAVNLFVIGAMAGAALLGARTADRHRPLHMGGPMMAAGHTLGERDRAAFRAALHEQAAVAGAQLRESRQLRRSAWLRLGDEPVDQAAILRDLDRARALEMQARAQVDRRVLAFGAGLPRDERARFGEALAPRVRHGPAPLLRGPPPPP